MRFRTLGHSGLKVSEITCGNWLTHEPDRRAESKACVRAALDAGITTFDTADIYGAPRYGVAEEILGDALTGVRRESVQILTKVCLPSGPGPNDRGLSRKHVMESCAASLRRLRTDHLDLYQAHRFDDETPLEETMLVFADLVRAGKVLYVGVSEWSAAQIHAAAAIAKELHVPLISNQPQYSLLWRVIEAEVAPVCESLGIGQIVWSPLAQGVLAGKYLPGAPLPPGSRAVGERGARFVARYMGKPVLEAVQRLVPIAADLGTTLPRLALAWVLPGTVGGQHLRHPRRPRRRRAEGHRRSPDRPGARRPGGTIPSQDGETVRRDGSVAPLTVSARRKPAVRLIAADRKGFRRSVGSCEQPFQATKPSMPEPRHPYPGNPARSSELSVPAGSVETGGPRAHQWDFRVGTGGGTTLRSAERMRAIVSHSPMWTCRAALFPSRRCVRRRGARPFNAVRAGSLGRS
jgi:aryl-alcohol dehydrogenase-like predicted oxidoreductase